MAQIEAFLIDIGNVLVQFDFQIAGEAIQEKTARRGDPMPALGELLQEFELGAIDSTGFVNQAIDKTGFQGSPEEFTQIYQSIFTPIPQIWDLVGSLGGRFPLYLFSNTSQLHHQGLLRDFPVFGSFQDGVFSYLVHATKPDPAIYQAAIQQLRLTPEKTIYLDDKEENIQAGLELGFHAHRYDHKNHQACIRFLEKKGIR